MNLRFISALNRVRLRRQIALERARLDEMKENARLLIDAQVMRVARLESRVTGARAISHAIEMREKSAVLH